MTWEKANAGENLVPDEGQQKLLGDFILETSERLALKSNLLDGNLKAVDNWPEERFFSKKDSTLKKNTAFVKKVRNFSESYKDALLSDFDSLNLSKYVGEVASAITEAKIKMTDVAFMLQLCSLMYRRYSEFRVLLHDAWRKSFSQQKTEKCVNLSKVRLDLVLFADLITIGVLPEMESVRILSSQLTQLTSGDKESFTNLGIITSFLRACGDDWAGLIPRKIRNLSERLGREIPRSKFLPNERKIKCRGLFQDYYACAHSRLLSMTNEARRTIAANRAQLTNRGELHPERKERAELQIAACRKFHESVTLFSDIVDEDPPLPVATLITDTEDGLDSEGHLRAPVDVDIVNNPIFEDEDTRLFYESLPDIKAMIPGILYKESEKQTSKIAVGEQVQIEAEKLSFDDEEVDIEKVEHEIAEEESRMATEELACPGSLLPSTSEGTQEKEKSSAGEEHEEEGTSNAKLLMESFLTQLPNCVNRDLIDRAAIDFCTNLNRKPNRRRLARALSMVPRTRYDLLPFYARLVAALHPVMPDLSQDLNDMLTDEFRWHIAKKDQVNLELKLKTVRFIGELVKFKIFPADEALSCIKRLLPNFVHHQIEMACALLDTCGRFLYRSPESHLRTKAYLEVMRRKKTALHMDQRYVTMIDNAYYYCDPPKTVSQFGAVEFSPLQQFLRHLLYRELDKNSVNRILRLFRKVDWNDKDSVVFIEELFTHAWQVRFQHIDFLASILSGISVYHKDFATAVVDNVIEDIRVCMDLNDPSLSQRRLSMIKYLGLLYNYKLVDSLVIFNTLYSLITYGVSLDYLNPSSIDPPSAVNRISLVCTLLDTSGCYFARGKRRKKLNVFLIYFQRYFWSKRMHPLWIPPQLVAKQANPNALFDDSAILAVSTSISTTGSAGGEQRNVSDTAVQLVATQPSVFFGEILPGGFRPVDFPASVHQQFDETLRQLRMNPIANSLVQANNLVMRLEKRYEQRLLRLKVTYGLASEIKGCGKAMKGFAATTAPSANAQRLGQMETISEEAENDELKLDEDEFPLEDENSDDEDDDDFDEEANSRSQEAYESYLDNQGHFSNKDAASESGGSVDEGEEGDDDEGDDVDEEDDEVDDDEDEEASSEDESVCKNLRPKYVDCPEDHEFVAAFEKMIAEAMLSASNAIPGSSAASSSIGDCGVGSGNLSLSRTQLPSLDILNLTASRAKPTTPSQATSMSSQHAESLMASLEHRQGLRPAVSMPETQENKCNTVPFNLVVRKGHRLHLVPLAVPDNVQFAARFIQLEAAERAEKARMKKRVLEMHEAQKVAEEMDYGHWGPDVVLANQVPTNANRDRGVKYNHPKGAPDADAVFGSSSTSTNVATYSAGRNLRR